MPGSIEAILVAVKSGQPMQNLASAALVAGSGWNLRLSPLETAVVPAAAGAYRVEPEGACQLLLAYAD